MRAFSVRPRNLIAALCFCVSFAAALHAQSPEERVTWRIAEAPPELQPLISRANVIIASIHDSLLWELQSALAQGGTLLAIRSCHVDATGYAQRIGRQEGLAAGRTSDRLRNPTNAPRPWAAPIVRTYAGRRAKDVEGFVVDLGDKVGVIKPIAERPVCGSCHGRPEEFSSAVVAGLKDRYPADRAIGFQEGEIRGWYWVEIPRKRSR